MHSARYFNLLNNVGCIARMRILWKNGSTSGTYEPAGYHDVLLGGERTIDMRAQTGIPEGAKVELYVEIAVCADQRANEEFIYDPKCGEMICYQLDGSIISNELKRYSPVFGDD